MIQVQLLRPTQHLENGKVRNYFRGDFLEVSAVTAQEWISKKIAMLPEGATFADLDDTQWSDVAVVVEGEDRALVKRLGIKALVITGDLEILQAALLDYERVLFWSKRLVPRLPDLGQFVQGFKAIERWEVATPQRFSVLAQDVGSEDARARTAELVGDLRVPLYEPGLMFVRRSTASKDLLSAWANERQGVESADDDRLAFYRAVWLVKPTIASFPESWVLKS